MRFVDHYMPTGVKGFPCISVPMFSTTMVEASSGQEDANQNWSQALQKFRLPKVITTMQVYNQLLAHWYAMRGPARLFPFRDPLDMASADVECANVVPTITGLDQQIGTGDGVRRDWQLVKTYTAGAEEYTRDIQLPIVSSVVVLLDGDTLAAATGGPYVATITREGGNLNLNPAPPDGMAITAGFLFDVPVRYENDSVLEGIVESMQVNGFADLTLMERRLC